MLSSTAAAPVEGLTAGTAVTGSRGEHGGWGCVCRHGAPLPEADGQHVEQTGLAPRDGQASFRRTRGPCSQRPRCSRLSSEPWVKGQPVGAADLVPAFTSPLQQSKKGLFTVFRGRQP